MERITHFEFSTADPDKTAEFYSKVFGWTVTKWDGPQPYWLVDTGEGEPGIDGGFMIARDTTPPVVNTVSVDSVDDAVERITAAGGTVAVPKMTIPGIGYQAYCIDPTGIMFGIHQSDESAS